MPRYQLLILLVLFSCGRKQITNKSNSDKSTVQNSQTLDSSALRIGLWDHSELIFVTSKYGDKKAHSKFLETR